MTDASAYRELLVPASHGLRLFARDYGPPGGAALPALCLPGLSRNSADFHVLAVALATDPARPRRVLSLDYRGRGRSERDPDWRNYDVAVEAKDVLQVAAAAGIERAAIIGTSRGGIIAMALAAARPTLLGAVVLNDIGPELAPEGLARIRGYVGKLPRPRDLDHAAAILKEVAGGRFPAFTQADWREMAEATWTAGAGGLTLAYDPALAKVLESIDPDKPPPAFWPLFEGLRGVPTLALRGETSDLLSAETLAEMARRHPGLETITVPGQGHAPSLSRPEIVARIKRFIRRAEASPGSRSA